MKTKLVYSVCMKNHLLFLFFSLAIPPVSANTISIQTLNIYGPFYAGNKEERKNSLSQFLKNESSDINFLQEVWFERDYQQLKKTSQALGLSSIYHNKLLKYNQRSGLMTITKGDIYKKDFHLFPKENGFIGYIYSLLNIYKGFGAIYTTLPKNSNAPLIAVNIHLHYLNQEIRLRQLVYYLKWFLNESILKHPIIFAGDFNFEPNSLEFEMIKYIFRFKEPQSQLNLPYHCTICLENKSLLGYIGSKIVKIDYERTIDYIFFRSSSTIRLTAKSFAVFPKKYNGVFLSDHYGAKAEIEFEPHPQPQAITQSVLGIRIELFLETLDKIQNQLSQKPPLPNDIPMSEYYKTTTAQISAIQFLESLSHRLKKRDSLLIQHLSQN